MKAPALILLMLVLFFSGCIQQQTITYVCPDGSEVADPSLCHAPGQLPGPLAEEPAANPGQVQAAPAENETQAIPQEPPPNISCYKNDGGDKFFRSVAVIRSGPTILQQQEDVCLSPSDLKEFYCHGGELRYLTYECSNGCAEGRCNRELVRSECIDTDGGGAGHLNTRGRIIYRDYYSDGSMEERFLVEDYCDGTTLTEYSCPGSMDTTSRYRKSELACLGCSDGACPP